MEHQPRMKNLLFFFRKIFPVNSEGEAYTIDDRIDLFLSNIFKPYIFQKIKDMDITIFTDQRQEVREFLPNGVGQQLKIRLILWELKC